MDRWKDGYMDRWKDGYMDKFKDKYGYVNSWIGIHMDQFKGKNLYVLYRQMDKQMNVWIETYVFRLQMNIKEKRQIYTQMDRWIYG